MIEFQKNKVMKDDSYICTIYKTLNNGYEIEINEDIQYDSLGPEDLIAIANKLTELNEVKE